MKPLINKIIYYNKKTIIVLFVVVFLFSIIYNIPPWVLGKTVEHYSQHTLKLYDMDGNFWDGSGLLIVHNVKGNKAAPLVRMNWKITLGFKKFIDIKFNIGMKQIADLYLNIDGINLDNLDLSLSIVQISQIMDLINDMGISGNIKVSAPHINLGKKNIGHFNTMLDNISSSMSPVNPLGSYTIDFNTANNQITVNYAPDSAIMLKGTGDFNSLIVNASVNESKKEKLQQLMTALGVPNPDGSYNLKIF